MEVLMKRYLALLIALLLAALMLSACNDSAPDSTDTTLSADTTVPETDPLPTDIELIKDGVANYTIVRADKADSRTVKAASLLMESFGQYTGVRPQLSTDWIRKGEEHDPSTREILIGITNYKESAQALEGVQYGDYVIKEIGNKLVINAWSPLALDSAITELVKEMMNSASEGNFSLSPDALKTGTTIRSLNALPVYADGGPDTIYRLDDNDYLLLFEEATPDSYDTYCRALSESGFSLYTQNDVTDNRFSTFTNEDSILNIGYYAYEKAIRLVVEPRTVLPKLETENTYTATQAPEFVFFGLYVGPDYGGGQSMLWQLADGSYIVVDGGYNLADHATQLYLHMRKNAPDPNNITIAAWILTHAHGDHHGAFLQFCKLYTNRVKIEMFVGNFPSGEIRKAGGITDGMSASKITSYMTENFPGVPLLKARVGQKLHIRDAEVEILYTHDSFAPRELTYLNTASLIFAMNIGGQRFLITGDASQDACLITHSMYGDSLKSDYVQIAHHGAGVGSSSIFGLTSLYSSAQAPVVLWPASDRAYNSYSGNAHNAHALKLDSTKEIIVAGSRVFRVVLPYTPGTSDQPTILK